MSEELKPCPFCGNDAPREGKISGAVWCEDCHSVGNDRDRWNTRPAEDSLAAKIKELETENNQLQIKLLEALDQTKDLRAAYDILFHAVCGFSCVYKESQVRKMTCCDWSKLIDAFDRAIRKLEELKEGEE